MRTFLARFGPDHCIEFRLIRDDDVQRMWTRLSQLHVIEGKLRRLDAEGWDVYAGVNPRASARSDERSVCEVVALHVDIDCPGEDEEGRRCVRSVKSTGKKENADAGQPGAVRNFFFLCDLFGVKRRMETDASEGSGASVPEPSMVISSGHGVHAYWILGVPVAVTAANREHFKDINRGLAVAVGGDAACCDLSRVLRVPTFHNHKREPAEEVTVLSNNGSRYTIDQLAPFALTGSGSSRSTQPITLPDIVPPMTAELDERFRVLRRRDGTMSRAFRGEIGDGSSDSRFVLVTKLREHGFSPEEILAIVPSRTWLNRRTRKVRSPEAVIADVRRLLRGR